MNIFPFTGRKRNARSAGWLVDLEFQDCRIGSNDDFFSALVFRGETTGEGYPLDIALVAAPLR